MNAPFIDNQDLLLSCAILDQSDTGSNLSFGYELMDSQVNPDTFISVDQQLNSNLQPNFESPQEIKEEIIDFNIFELLQADDPEMARLLESVSSDQMSYLPQISVNSTKKILENATNSVNNSQPLSRNQSDSSFQELSDLLDLNESKSEESQKIKTLPVTPPLTPLAPSRVSMRLIKKKNSRYLDIKSEDELEVVKKSARGARNTTKTKLTTLTLKRKRSIDEDDEDFNESSSGTNLLSNENSVDFDSDHIYYNDEDSLNSFASQHRYRRMRSDSKELDPVKKESNKEAATRYRIKKLNEKDKLFETRVGLEKENDQVKKRIELVQTEINYLKNLLVQMLLTKGVLNSSGTGLL